MENCIWYDLCTGKVFMTSFVKRLIVSSTQRCHCRVTFLSTFNNDTLKLNYLLFSLSIEPSIIFVYIFIINYYDYIKHILGTWSLTYLWSRNTCVCPRVDEGENTETVNINSVTKVTVFFCIGTFNQTLRMISKDIHILCVQPLFNLFF